MPGVRDRMADTSGNLASPVSTTVATALNEQFDLLEQGLQAEVVNQQTRADELNNPIQACNAAKHSAFTATDGVDFLANKVTGARTTHSQCRSDELASCDAYKNQASALRSAAPTCSCGDPYGTSQ